MAAAAAAGPVSLLRRWWARGALCGPAAVCATPPLFEDRQQIKWPSRQLHLMSTFAARDPHIRRLARRTRVQQHIRVLRGPYCLSTNHAKNIIFAQASVGGRRSRYLVGVARVGVK
jgi:hypothetical protein